MRFRKLSKHAALGVGAMGLVIASSGVTALASNLASPAGALSVQVPAVAVREQNVNSAGRIRVALPKGGVGVNGSVSVNNFPNTQAVSGTVNVGNLPTSPGGRLQTNVSAPNQFGSTVACGNGSYRSWQMLPPLPAGQTYHLGLVTVLSNSNVEYDFTTSSGAYVAAVESPPDTTSVLPFGGTVLGSGQGLELQTNVNGCGVRVTFGYWVGSAG